MSNPESPKDVTAPVDRPTFAPPKVDTEKGKTGGGEKLAIGGLFDEFHVPVKGGETIVITREGTDVPSQHLESVQAAADDHRMHLRPVD